MSDSHPVTSQQLLRPARDVEFFADWDPRSQPNDPLLCAELCRLAYAPFSVIESTLSRFGFDSVQSLRPGNHNSPALTGGDGFVAFHPTLDLSVATFRGTEAGNLEDALTDMLTLPVGWFAGGMVHAGFATGYSAMRPRLLDLLSGGPRRLLLTGHSLGGALANLAAVDFPHAELLTFGAPRVGNSDFVNLLRGVSIHRFVNCCDIVQRVPPETFGERDLADLFNALLTVDATGLTTAEQVGLAAARGAGRLAARGIATLLNRAGIHADFRHAGDVIYIRHDGSLVTGPDDDAIRLDQIMGRGLYRGVVQQAMPALDPQRVLERLAAMTRLSVGGELTGALAELNGLFRDIARSATLAHVVLRDFADHAPSTYIDALRRAY